MISSVKHIIAVASGKGGVGKSTIAINLAIALSKLGQEVGLLDADIYGPSQQRMLGVSDDIQPEQKDGKYISPILAHGIKAMSIGFLSGQGVPMIWRGPMAGSALTQMLEQTFWGDLDYLLVDMPPGTGDIQLTLSQKTSLSGAVIVTTPQDIALLDAKKGIEMFRKVNVPILGIIENMAVHVCAECGYREHVFGSDGGKKLSLDYKVRTLASLPLDIKIREESDSGSPVVISLPDSEVSQCFEAAANEVLEALKTKTERVDFPEIKISED